ncbi:MAG: hypothetical protein QM658_14265 [Gordonia sp. (in: high G+C Gram-positive bacteria)]
MNDTITSPTVATPTADQLAKVRELASNLIDTVSTLERSATLSADETAIRDRLNALVAAGAESADISYSETFGHIRVLAFGLDASMYAEVGSYADPVHIGRLYAEAGTVVASVMLPGESILTMLDMLLALVVDGQERAA